MQCRRGSITKNTPHTTQTLMHDAHAISMSEWRITRHRSHNGGYECRDRGLRILGQITRMSCTMGAKVAKSQRPKPKYRDEESPAFETLVRQLVAHARHAAAQPPEPTSRDEAAKEESGEVLVDLEVDGVRCVLARTHSVPAEPVRLSPREL